MLAKLCGGSKIKSAKLPVSLPFNGLGRLLREQTPVEAHRVAGEDVVVNHQPHEVVALLEHSIVSTRIFTFIFWDIYERRAYYQS